MRRRLSLALLGLACGLAGGPAAAASGETLCGRMWIPEELELVCRPMAGGEGSSAVDVVPPGVSSPLLSRMTVRELERQGEDALAWEDPAAWLSRQMTVDTSQFAQTIRGYLDDPDSPLGGEVARDAAGSLLDGLDMLGRLALAGCDDPRENEPAGYWEMACDFTAGGLGVFTHLRLQANGTERLAVSMRTMNERRMRHFEAIAGTLGPER